MAKKELRLVCPECAVKVAWNGAQYVCPSCAWTESRAFPPSSSSLIPIPKTRARKRKI